MNDRDRALEVLRKSRDLLAERLTQRVLEKAEELLDDARGDSYLGDIETLYEQFGMKLTHLNQLINNLPAEPAAAASAYTSSYDTNTPPTFESTATEVVAPAPPALGGPLIVAPPALPAPRLLDAAETPAPSFPLFAAQVKSGDLLDAGKTLAALLDFSEARGLQCARAFARRGADDDLVFHKLLQLRNQVAANHFNESLILLAECFGLGGMEAVGALQALRLRLPAAG